MISVLLFQAFLTVVFYILFFSHYYKTATAHRFSWYFSRREEERTGWGWRPCYHFISWCGTPQIHVDTMQWLQIYCEEACHPFFCLWFSINNRLQSPWVPGLCFATYHSNPLKFLLTMWEFPVLPNRFACIMLRSVCLLLERNPLFFKDRNILM